MRLPFLPVARRISICTANFAAWMAEALNQCYMFLAVFETSPSRLQLPWPARRLRKASLSLKEVLQTNIWRVCPR